MQLSSQSVRVVGYAVSLESCFILLNISDNKIEVGCQLPAHGQCQAVWNMKEAPLDAGVDGADANFSHTNSLPVHIVIHSSHHYNRGQ